MSTGAMDQFFGIQARYLKQWFYEADGRTPTFSPPNFFPPTHPNPTPAKNEVDYIDDDSPPGYLST